MRTHRGLRTLEMAHAQRLALVLALALVCAGCGVTSGQALGGTPAGTPTGSAGSANGRTTATETAGAAHAGPGATPAGGSGGTGAGGGESCPAANGQAANTRPAPDVIVGQTGIEQHVALHQGQTVEFRLGTTFEWLLLVSDPAHVLSAQQPRGAYDSQLNLCVWRFAVVAAGTAHLTFDGEPHCKGGTTCPQLALEQEYDVTSV
ncbi:MAG TPA: hypothetical protein VLJ14_10580 [Ktedonobacterales bacterium]|jgi:hypothetical protein|nr:hypothetical protein [Ktedonobacterales bacterium]